VPPPDFSPTKTHHFLLVGLLLADVAVFEGVDAGQQCEEGVVGVGPTQVLLLAGRRGVEEEEEEGLQLSVD
jgi:hypothetical protein